MVVASFIGYYAGTELVSETSKGIFNSIYNIITDKHPEIQEITQPMDLTSKVRVVESIVREVDSEIDHEDLEDNEPLRVSLLEVKEILENIHKDLENIKDGIEYHKTLWFHRFRSAGYKTTIHKLKLDKNALDSRLDNLVRVIALFRSKKN